MKWLRFLQSRPVCQINGRSAPNMIEEARREHSRKPEAAYSQVEKMVKGPRVELFSRTSREGWSTWGNETGAFDGGRTVQRRRSQQKGAAGLFDVEGRKAMEKAWS